MKLSRSVISASLLIAALQTSALAQGVPPIDHVFINDPRLFDISDNGTPYALADGPQATATLNLVQGPAGTLAGSITVTDEFANIWGPIPLSGDLLLRSTLPLSLRLSGGGAGQAKVKITGSYDPGVTLMKVLVDVKTPQKLKYQWNDGFIPVYANDTGATISRTSVASNTKFVIRGTHTITGPATSLGIATQDRQLINSGFQLKGPGLNVIGQFNNVSNTFPVSNARFSIGYGPIFTPGSLVTVTTDNFFVRLP